MQRMAITTFVPLLILLASAASAETESPRKSRIRGDRVSVFSGSVHIPADSYQDGSVVVIGSDAVIEGDVRQDVIVIGGELRLTGKVRGSVISVLTNTQLDRANIEDQLVSVAGRLERNDTDVGGQVFQIGFGEWLPDLPGSFGVLGLILFWTRLFKMLLTFVVIVLLAAIVPQRIRTLSDQAPVRYLVALFIGLLGYLGALIVMLLATATIVGLPIAIAVFLLLKWLGIVGLFHAIGARIGRSMGREMSLLGAILLTFVPFALISLAPYFFGLAGLVASMTVGTLFWFFFEVPGLGLVLLTRAGAPPRATAAAPPVPAPAPPVVTVPAEPTE